MPLNLEIGKNKEEADCTFKPSRKTEPEKSDGSLLLSRMRRWICAFFYSECSRK